MLDIIIYNDNEEALTRTEFSERCMEAIQNIQSLQDMINNNTLPYDIDEAKKQAIQELNLEHVQFSIHFDEDRNFILRLTS